MLEKKKRFRKQSFKRLLKDAIDTGVSFNDDTFKCEDKSVAITTQFRASLDSGSFVWKRPKEIAEIPHFLFLEKLGPASQIEFIGRGVNEWFIAACCAIATDRNLIYKVVTKNQLHFLHGIVKFNLWKFGNWNKVVIDDKLPTFDNEPIFSSSPLPVFWLPLLEKAYAKLHGSYESMSQFSNLCSAITDLTGAMCENVPMEGTIGEANGTNGMIDRERFRFMSELLDRKAIICATSKERDVPSNAYNIKENRIYLVKNVKKPSSGTFSKTFKKDVSPALIHLIDTIYDKERSSNRNKATIKLHDVWLPIEDFNKSFQTLTVCHVNSTDKISSATGKSATQFCFDVKEDSEEVIVELTQMTNDSPSSLKFKIYHVEMNRKYKIHNTAMVKSTFVSDSIKTHTITKRIKLAFGRYVLIPTCANNDTDLLLRIQSFKPSNLKILKHDMPRKNIFSFVSPRYPKYITQIVIKNITGLEKQDRFGSANPYCLIRCGRKSIKSTPLHDTLNPDWGYFSAIFYHGRFATITIEVWNHGMIINTFIGKVDIVLKSTSETSSFEEAELCGRKKGHKRPGIIKYQIQTSEDLRSF